MSQKMITITEEQKQEWATLAEEKMTEFRNDVTTNEGWATLSEDHGVLAQQKNGEEFHKVRGGTLIKTDLTPEDIMNWLDSKSVTRADN
jgi:hypothetical protein